MGIKGMKQMAKSMKNVDMKETRDIMVSIHEHLEIIAKSNLQIVKLLEKQTKQNAEEIDLKEHHN